MKSVKSKVSSQSANKKDRPRASAKEKRALKDLPDAYLECRSYRFHALIPKSLFHWRDGNAKGICRSSVCTRCGTVRDDFYNSNGFLVDRIYNYPEDYQVPGSRIYNNDVMKELFRRAENVAASRDDAVALTRHLHAVGD